MNTPIKVLVVDDSYFMRRIITEILESDPQLQVIGTASNGDEGLEKIKTLQPDVVTLDIDMPGMNGLSMIRHIMIHNPLPIVVFSSLFCYGDVTFDSLELGVVDFVPKPSGMVFEDKNYLCDIIIDRVKNASGVNIGNVRRGYAKPVLVNARRSSRALLEGIITIGAGLSGASSVIRLVSQLSPSFPAAAVAMIEIAPQVLPSFVKKFNERNYWKIELIEDGQAINPGVCYIGSHENATRIELDNFNAPCFRMEGKTEEPINTLFRSAADVFDSNTIGVLLAGLGNDGAAGFSHIQLCNGVTIAQNTNCCVFPNLTQNAINMGAVTHVVDEDYLHVAINSYMEPEEQTKVA